MYRKCLRLVAGACKHSSACNHGNNTVAMTPELSRNVTQHSNHNQDNRSHKKRLDTLIHCYRLSGLTAAAGVARGFQWLKMVKK